MTYSGYRELTTEAQREAIRKLWHRSVSDSDSAGLVTARDYRVWLSSVAPTIGCNGAVVVLFAGMFVCVERDGYTHS